jgi:hypothetical protein
MRREEQLFDADITPGISDEPLPPKDEEHVVNIGALADGGNADLSNEPDRAAPIEPRRS